MGRGRESTKACMMFANSHGLVTVEGLLGCCPGLCTQRWPRPCCPRSALRRAPCEALLPGHRRQLQMRLPPVPSTFVREHVSGACMGRGKHNTCCIPVPEQSSL